jgi:hypothetical protein
VSPNPYPNDLFEEMTTAKFTFVGTVLRMGEREIKEDDRGGEFNLIYCKYFCKCHTVPPVQQ